MYAPSPTLIPTQLCFIYCKKNVPEMLRDFPDIYAWWEFIKNFISMIQIRLFLQIVPKQSKNKYDSWTWVAELNLIPSVAQPSSAIHDISYFSAAADKLPSSSSSTSITSSTMLKKLGTTFGTDKQTSRQTARQTDIQTNRQTYRVRCWVAFRN